MMKKILVTGCNGQLGRAIRQEYKGEDVSFINTDVAEGEGMDIEIKVRRIRSVVLAEKVFFTFVSYSIEGILPLRIDKVNSSSGSSIEIG